MKTQTVRLFDVFVIGPVVILAGSSRGRLTDAMRIALVVIGIATIVFNAVNYLAIRSGSPERASEGD